MHFCMLKHGPSTLFFFLLNSTFQSLVARNLLPEKSNKLSLTELCLVYFQMSSWWALSIFGLEPTLAMSPNSLCASVTWHGFVGHYFFLTMSAECETLRVLFQRTALFSGLLTSELDGYLLKYIMYRLKIEHSGFITQEQAIQLDEVKEFK